jgi:hypothetical protein
MFWDSQSGSVQVLRVIIPQDALIPLQPPGKASTRSLSIDVGPGPGKHIKAGRLGRAEEVLEVKDAVIPELALRPLEERPVDVEADGVEAESLDLLEDVEVEVRDGEAEGVDLAGEDHGALAADEEGVVVVGDEVLELGRSVGGAGVSDRVRLMMAWVGSLLAAFVMLLVVLVDLPMEMIVVVAAAAAVLRLVDHVQRPTGVDVGKADGMAGWGAGERSQHRENRRQLHLCC